MNRRRVPTMRSRVTLVVAAVVFTGLTATNLAAGPAAPSSVGPCRADLTHACPQVRISRVTRSTVRSDQPGAAPDAPFRELQMNLCDSGKAGCYRGGQSPGAAARLVNRYRPVAVTVNEVCSQDVLGEDAPIPTAMARVAAGAGDGMVVSLFASAKYQDSTMPYQCADGDQYGIGMVLRGPETAVDTRSWIYDQQDTGSNENRVAVCASLDGVYQACTTHLTADDSSVAMKQCHQLMDPAAGFVSAFRSREGDGPTLVAGDLNLSHGGNPNVQDCVPPGWFRVGDGDVQHVMAAGGFRLISDRTVRVPYTDHPALLVDLAYPRPASRVH